jgi:hypothetical protein
MNCHTDDSLIAMRQTIVDNKPNYEELRELRQMAREARSNAARIAKSLSSAAKKKNSPFTTHAF